ncbi:MAG TPA: metallophosphoesterase [Kofleriaceae bacterium]
MLRALLFFSIFALVIFYLRQRLIVNTGLAGKARIAAYAFFALLVAPLIIVNLMKLGAPPTLGGVLAWPTYIGQALLMLMFAALLVSDVVRLIVWLARRATKQAPMDLSRRQALARITGGVVTTAVVAHVGYGVTRALGDADIVDVPITLAKLPKGLDGFTIVQVTDVHVGGTIGKEFIDELAARTMATKPDLIALTGDFIDGQVEDLSPHMEAFKTLAAPHGVYFTTGNHEYYSGVDPWLTWWRSIGVRVLRNERVSIEKNGGAFDLAGVDDHSADKYPGHGMDLAKALDGRDASRALVLMAHQPRQVHAAARYGVDLQISGHTHGGQVWPWHYIVALQQGGLVAGRYQIGDTQLYVSRGAGYWGPPVRVGAPPEITRYILRSAADA